MAYFNGNKIALFGGTGGSASAPVFDLVTLGLPTIPINGNMVTVTCDTANIITAMQKGVVRFTLKVGNADLPTTGTYMMNSIVNEDNSSYVCVACVNVTAVPCFINIVVTETMIFARANEIEKEMPTYDLTAMGIDTIVANGDPIVVETDTTNIMNDLANGDIVLIGNFDVGYGIPMKVSGVCRASCVEDTTYIITSVYDLMGDLLVASIMVMDGKISLSAYTNTVKVNALIDTYMEDALGGDY